MTLTVYATRKLKPGKRSSPCVPGVPQKFAKKATQRFSNEGEEGALDYLYELISTLAGRNNNREYYRDRILPLVPAELAEAYKEREKAAASAYEARVLKLKSGSVKKRNIGVSIPTISFMS